MAHALAEETDWLFHIWEGCAVCAFEPVSPDRIPGRIRDTIPGWWDALHRPHPRRRPEPGRWSTLEYACHILDISEVFSDRLVRVLAADGAVCPRFDGEAAASERGYGVRDPDETADALERELERVAQQFIDVPDTAWNRRGRRSDGVAFTVASMSNHFLHELHHHLHDVAERG